MRGFRSRGLIGEAARSLALFALLLQFTLPFGTALAASVSPGLHGFAASICLTGTQPLSDPDGPVAGHPCTMVGGCCVPAAAMSHLSVGCPTGAVEARTLSIPVSDDDPGGVACLPPPARGPPAPS